MPVAADPSATRPATTQQATLAAGCFWCIEAVLEQIPGVLDVESGYTGGQLANGAMGNARWLGVPLKDVLARAEVKNSARQVMFDGLDAGVFGGGDFVKSLDIGHAMDGEVMIAWQMNGAELPMLNGYPVRLVVPGYYGTYWVKHLSDIQVIDSVYEVWFAAIVAVLAIWAKGPAELAAP